MRDRDLPRGAGHEHFAAQQLRQQAAADQRRLAAAGGAHDGQEAVARQTLEQLERLFFAAEEEVVLFRGEGSQPGKRVPPSRCGTHAPTSLIRLTKRSSSASGSNAPGWRITAAWWE